MDVVGRAKQEPEPRSNILGYAQGWAVSWKYKEQTQYRHTQLP